MQQKMQADGHERLAGLLSNTNGSATAESRAQVKVTADHHVALMSKEKDSRMRHCLFQRHVFDMTGAAQPRTVKYLCLGF